MDLLVFTTLLLLLLIIGISRSKKIRSESAYLFANRQTKWLALTATLVMTEFNSATLISFSSMGYGVGFWALVLPFIFLFGLLFYGVTVAKKWKAYDGASVAGFFTQRYGKEIGTCTSFLLLLSMLGFSATYIKSLALIFHPLFPSINLWLLSGVLIGFVLLMSIRGGLRAIIRTDFLSMVFMLIFFPVVAFIMWRSPTLPTITSYSIEGATTLLPFKFVFSLIILTMFTYILAPWYGQKIFSAVSGRVAFWSVIAAAFLVFLLYGSAIVATAFFRCRGYDCPQWEQALPSLLVRCLPHGLKGVGYTLLFATSATTLTGVWSAMSAMWIGDFMHSPEEGGCKRGIFLTLCFALFSYILANTLVDRVFDKLILANIPVAALSFGLLAGFYWKRASRLGVYLSLLVGCLCGTGAYWYYGESGCYTWYWAVYGIPLIFLSGMVGSIFPLTQKEPSL